MRLESLQPESESDFYRSIAARTFGRIFWERVEPADESGFPDTYFVIAEEQSDVVFIEEEGTVELKYSETLEPNLRNLARGTQKAGLLNYHAAGGKRRFALCYCKGRVYLWNTQDYSIAIRGDGRNWTSSKMLDDPEFTEWLVRELTDK